MNKNTSTYKAGMLILTVLILFSAASVIMAFIPGIFESGNLMKMYAVNTLLVSVISIFVPAFIFMRKFGDVRSCLRRISIKQYLFSFFMGVGVFLIAAAVNTIFFELFELTGADTSVLSTDLPQMDDLFSFFLSLVLIAVIPALTEEFLFRGALLHSWKGLGRMRAVLLTALIFSLVHYSLPSLPALFLIGALIGFMAYDSGSIWPGVIVHFLNNALSLWFSLFENESTAVSPEWMTWAVAAVFLIIGAAIFIPAFIAFRKASGPCKEEADITGDSEIMMIKPAFPKAQVIIAIAVMGMMTLFSALAMYIPVPM